MAAKSGVEQCRGAGYIAPFNAIGLLLLLLMAVMGGASAGWVTNKLTPRCAGTELIVCYHA